MVQCIRPSRTDGSSMFGWAGPSLFGRCLQAHWMYRVNSLMSRGGGGGAFAADVLARLLHARPGMGAGGGYS